MSFLSFFTGSLFGSATPPQVETQPAPRLPRRLARPVRPTAGETPAELETIFAIEYRNVRPRAPIPPIHVSFYGFVHINNTIRLRQGEIHVRLSDTLEGAPESVLSAIAHILLARMYRKPVAAQASAAFRRYANSARVASHSERLVKARGRKVHLGAQGSIYDLDEIFDALNLRFFHGLMAKPVLTWSPKAARRTLGHYDAAHNTIVVSRIFDRPQVPRYAIDYLMYHEMLHLVHPVRMAGARRCVHPREFQQDEKRFPELAEAKLYLRKRL